MEYSESSGTRLPENAYKKLPAGEEYIPVIPSHKIVPDLTPYSLIWGLFYAVLFSMAAAYLGLKIGQVFEAAIPIAILAVGTSVLLGRKNALQENVIIQSIGSSSGVVVAGAIFTIPGLYILGLNASFLQIFLASLLGGCLGILLLIPFNSSTYSLLCISFRLSASDQIQVSIMIFILQLFVSCNHNLGHSLFC